MNKYQFAKEIAAAQLGAEAVQNLATALVDAQRDAPLEDALAMEGEATQLSIAASLIIGCLGKQPSRE